MTTKVYSFYTAGRIIGGPGSIKEIGQHLSAFEASRALIVTDPGVAKTGIPDRVRQLVEDSGVKTGLLSEVMAEPPINQVDELYERVRSGDYEVLIGVGGGSSLDMTKLLAARMTNDCSVSEFLGTEKVKKPALPTVLIPTTAGTGSEVTPNAIVTLPDQELKVGIVSKYFLPDLVILDVELTAGLPPKLTASTGMDAFIHSLESFISTKANPLSDTFALRSMRLIGRSIRKAFSHGDDLEARHAMLIGSTLGGMALTAAGTAAVHALAYPLGGKFAVPHGVANSMLLVPVMEYNFDAIKPRLAEVADAMGIDAGGRTTDSRAKAAMEELRALVKDLEIPSNMSVFGVTEGDLDFLAEAASKVTRLLGNNPKKMSVEDIREVYGKLL
ncbi:MAG: iron-containing alcohol dehydrogenase [Bacillota bacterium]|nr:iron-containing alcohol dehydrogenase [Candidatus Fermentithermobacillaceae bacterium]